MQVREVLEAYHAHPPVGRFSFRRLVGVYGSGPFHDQDERYAEGIRRLNTTRPQRVPRSKHRCVPCALRERAVTSSAHAVETRLNRTTNRRVTLAHHFLQFFAIQYLDDGPTIVDCARVTQDDSGGRHARSAHPEHFRKRLLAELDIIGASIRR